MLEHWIESDVYSRQCEAVTNFSNALPPPQSDLAKESVRDPYNFKLREPIAECELEEGVLAHICKFLLGLAPSVSRLRAARQVNLYRPRPVKIVSHRLVPLK